MIDTIIKTDTSGTARVDFTSTGMKITDGGLSLDGSTPVSGQLTGVTLTTPTLNVLDNALSIKDNSDPTKIAQFQCSGITTATTRTFTFPDADATLVGLATTQTLTNKTLTAPVISTISNTGTVTLPTATDTLVGRATTDTLTNKTLTSPVINTPTIKALTEVVTAANVITAAETGSVFFLSSATEFASTLPAAAAGLKFTFIVTAAPSGASYTITTDSSANIIKGQVYTLDVNSATDPDFETAGGDTISFVDAKAVAGDRVDVICDGTNWFAYGFCSVFDAITITTAS